MTNDLQNVQTNPAVLEQLEPRLLLSGTVMITEFMADNDNTLLDGDGNSSDWVEIYNDSDAVVNINDWYMTDDAGDLAKWRLPDAGVTDLTLQPGQYLVVMASGAGDDDNIVDYIDSAGYIHANFALDVDGDSIALVESDGATVVDAYWDFSPQVEDVSYGIGAEVSLTTFVQDAGEVDYLVPADGTLGATWTNAGFTPGAEWSSGSLGVGYESSGSDYANLIESFVPAGTVSAYTRMEFDVANASAVAALTLRMKYDDGFVAYLNGWKVESANAPVSPVWNSTASAPHSDQQAKVFQDFSLSSHIDKLLTGSNVLAVHSLNTHSGSSDLLMLPELLGYVSSGMTDYGFFASATPGSANAQSFLGFVGDTAFSVDRGFYDTAFDVEISCDTDGAVIRYTLDGSTPTSSTGTIYSVPINVSGTTTLRAAAFKNGYEPSNVDTQTYIFIDDVVNQSSSPGGLWPTSSINGQVFDYGMDPDIVGGYNTLQQVKDALTSISTISLVTDMDNLFDSSTGIYVNPREDGYEWERPASMELIHPDDISGPGFVDSVLEGFQINAGLRIRGGSSRTPSNPKHSFRLFFRSEYGDSKLEFPLFGDEGADEFDKVDLRTGQNFSWNNSTGDRAAYATWLYDIFTRDTARDMDQPYTRGRYYHLYLNGQYWGLYQTEERPEANFGESYMGGNDADYDALKSGDNQGVIEATDGTLDGYYDLWSEVNSGVTSNSDYFRIQGMNVDGTTNPAYTRLLDVENLIDYMIPVFYGGNTDMPLGPPHGGTIPRNLFMLYNRVNPDGVQFIPHDAEHSLELSRGVNFNYVDHTLTSSLSLQQNCNPWWLHLELMADNEEYRIAFADRVHDYFFNDGLLTADAAVDRLLVRAAEIEIAIIAESARWGDAKAATSPMTNADWQAAVDMLVNDYMNASPSTRSDIVLQQLISAGWYPSSTEAPAFNQHGGRVSDGFELLITAPAGTIYYTLDGSDPRDIGGGVNAGASIYSGVPVTLIQSTEVKARVYSGGQWSALNRAEFRFNAQAAADNLVVSEINYNPYDPTDEELAVDGTFTASDFEFIELFNIGAETVDLSDVRFSVGVTFNFAITDTIEPGQRVVIVSNEAAFQARYGLGSVIAGQFTDGLSNGGDTISVSSGGTGIIYFNYDDSGDWPDRPDGNGSSVELIDPSGTDPASYADGDFWRSSNEYGGSPGLTGDGPIGDIVINEVFSHTDLPYVDAIELYNTTADAVDIGGWWLSDENDNYTKFRIPDGTILPGGQYVVFDEGDFNASGGVDANDFALSGSHGDDVYLMKADASGVLTNFVDHVEFGAASNGEAWGRWTNGEGDLYPMISPTLGLVNNGPRVGPVIISEVMYNPIDPDGVGGVDASDLEFIEIYNPTGASIDLAAWVDNPHTAGQYLADWRIRGGVDMEFEEGTSIGTGQTLVILSFDPNKAENASRLADFRDHYGIDASVALVGGYSSTLDGGGQRITLQRPDSPTIDESDFVPHLLEDQVVYDDLTPWPTGADGGGHSLHRIGVSLWGDDPASWTAAAPNPGLCSVTNNPPQVANPIADVTVDEEASDTILDLSGVFEDTDEDDILTLSVSGNTNPAIVSAGLAGTELTLSYAANQSGAVGITIWATDLVGAWIEDSFTVTVNPTPDPPSLNNPVADFSVDEDASDTVIDLAAVFDDPDLPGDTLAYSVTSNTNSGLVATSVVGSDLTLSYPADQNGSSEITVRATDQDGAGSWVEDTFTVTVDPINDAPTLVSPIADFAVDEDALDTVIDLSSVFDDVDLSDALTYEVALNTDSGLVATDVIGSDLTLSYLADQSGSADITVRATDSGAPGLFVEDTFTVTVNPINDAPTLIALLADVIVDQNDPDTIIDAAGVFDDVDSSDILTLSIEGNTNPDLVTVSLVGSDITLSYAADQYGSADVTIRATDSGTPGLWVEDTFTVTVNSDNLAPTVSSEIADLTVNTGDPDTVMYLSDVFDDSVGLNPTLDYTVIEIDPVTGAQSAGTGLFLYTFTLYGNDGVESVFATTTLTFTGAIQQTKAFGTADVNDELNAAIFEGIAGSGYLAGLDTWIFASWQEIAPNDTSLTGSPVVLSVGSGTAEYFEQKDVVQIVAAGDVQWTGMHARLGADYPTSGTADANRLAYSISDNTNPSLVTASVVGAQLTLDYSPGGSGVADITIRATDPDGAWAEDTFTVTVESSGEIVGRHVFYNNSAWDGVSDDDAIASDKTALLAGQTAGFANYTSYSRGINGIMVDIDGMTGTPDASDFIIKVNASDDPDTWSAGPTPTVTVRPGEGVGGSDRVTLVWPDGAIANQWVEVTVLATADTGLAAADVFYFGNAVGETSGDG
ncbi:MAG: lamin tail domain-containing protein, partial [Phycisphaerae bacterium]|nr:lamin tail domain-containing protein [Phycisphaerae bacterium]